MKLIVLIALFFLEVGEALSATAGKGSGNSGLAARQGKTVRLFEQGKGAAALPVAAEIVSILENSPERDPRTLAIADANFAILYDSVGDYLHAEAFYLQALEENNKAAGDHGLGARSTLQSLFVLYANMGVYPKAESILRREPQVATELVRREETEASLAETNRGTAWRKARFLLAIGWLNYVLEKHDAALSHATEALEISNGLSAEPSIADALNLSATVRYKRGDYDHALTIYLEALRISDSAKYEFGQARNWSSIGSTYYRQGNYRLALENYEKSLAARKRLGVKDETARAENDLANVYQEMGAYTKALELRQEARQLWEETGNKLGVANVLNDMGWLYETTGEFAKALDYLQRAVAIHREVSDAWGAADATDGLALIRLKMGQYGEALAGFREANKEFAQLGNREEEALTQEHIGEALHHLDKFEAAEIAFQAALKQYEKVFGTSSLRTAGTLTHLALLEIDLGQKPKAILFTQRATAAAETLLSNILSFTSEQQRLTFQKTTHPYELFATLGSAADLAQTVLRQKGVVLDSLLEDRLVAEASSNPKQREVIAELRAFRQRLMQLVLTVPKDLSEVAEKQRTAEKEKLSAEVEQLEGGLARQVTGLGKARSALSITVTQVQSVLPKQAVLIELLRYSDYLGKGKFAKRYGAVVIASTGEPKWVSLGTAAEIETNVRLYGKAARGETNKQALHSVLRSLYDQIWSPLEKLLPATTKTIIISPDGALNFISFATLLSATDEFLIEKYSLRYVASGRDLLREQKRSTSELMVAFGDPAFGRTPKLVAQQSPVESSSAKRALDLRGFENMLLSPLPGTAKECAALQAQAKAAGKPSQVFVGLEATEVQLGETNSPWILHLATHGFFLPESESHKAGTEQEQVGSETKLLGEMNPDRKPRVLLKDPMYRSGLALTGAQRTLEAWGKGEVPPSDNDGVVTAEEVGGLKLEGTWLVVLSACDSGTGEARAGEGVMGLRRGFIQAGAQNLLMTLWPINDDITVEIMKDFYAEARRTGNAPEALSNVQRNWLVKLRKEQGTGAEDKEKQRQVLPIQRQNQRTPLQKAVSLAGPFIMSSQGRP